MEGSGHGSGARQHVIGRRALAVAVREVVAGRRRWILVHCLLRTAPGAVYARQRYQCPWLRTGRGALYGVGLFLVNDRIAS
jgi:hypothetical protein